MSIQTIESRSIVKPRKVIDMRNMRHTRDRISDLPDSVLLCILSFISTKQVVQTSILSSRWRYVWTSIPTLEFDDRFFPFQRVSPTDANTRFVNFVDLVLGSHDVSDIQKFRLSFTDKDISHVDTWIGIVVKHNVQELDINVNKTSSMFLDYLLTCKSLVFMKLNFFFDFINLPDSIGLTRLRTLHLQLVSFEEKDVLPKLLSGCPVLENLIMVGCGWVWGFNDIEISSHTVKNFTINGSYLGISAEGTLSERTVNISMPNLISLKYIDFIAEDYHIENLPSLVDAYIDVRIGKNYWSEMYEDCGWRVINLLEAVSNARCLELTHTTLELLGDAEDLFELLPTFHNLHRLEVTCGRNEMHFEVLACLLRRCPVLEYLEIYMKSSTIYEFQYHNEDGLELDSLLLDHLKEVKIRYFGRTREEREFVSLLLRSPSKTKRRIILEEGEEYVEEVSVRSTEISIGT